MQAYLNFRFGDDFQSHLAMLAQKGEQSALQGFTTSFLAILVSEIGDKTFFLAMIMALRYNKFIVFLGAYGALFLMTVLSAIFGKVVTSWISETFTNIIVTILFFYFGAKMIYESTQHEQNEENEELKEVEIELKEMEQKFIQRNSQSVKNQQQLPSKPKKATKPQLPNMFIFGQAFMMTFLAEWGDRSQIATIALAASFNLFMVTLGALLGHLICTMGAVQIGEWISGKVSEKYVLLAGGIVFILSGFVTLIMIF